MRKKEFAKVPIKTLLLFSVCLLVVGLITKIQMYFALGVFTFFAFGIYLFIQYLRFEIAYKQFLKQLTIQSKTANYNFNFSFDSEVISYTSENVRTEIKWSKIKSFTLNGTDLYLFEENKADKSSREANLFEIVSEKIIGAELFEKFVAITKTKFQN